MDAFLLYWEKVTPYTGVVLALIVVAVLVRFFWRTDSATSEERRRLETKVRDFLDLDNQEVRDA